MIQCTLAALITFSRGGWGMRLCAQLIAHPSNKSRSFRALSVGIGRLQPVRTPAYRHLYGLQALLVPGQRSRFRARRGQEELFLHTLVVHFVSARAGIEVTHLALVFMVHSSAISSCNDNRGLRKVTQIRKSESHFSQLPLFKSLQLCKYKCIIIVCIFIMKTLKTSAM